MSVRYSVKDEGHENIVVVTMAAGEHRAKTSKAVPAVSVEHFIAILLNERQTAYDKGWGK